MTARTFSGCWRILPSQPAFPKLTSMRSVPAETSDREVRNQQRAGTRAGCRRIHEKGPTVT